MKLNRFICFKLMLLGIIPGLFAFPISNDTLSKAPDNWYHLDEKMDHVRGISSDRAYQEFLNDKTPTEVVVAVIDGGIDIDHDDLDDNIWVNEEEIPDNGIDDDGNGYVDDIHGWNFIGGSDGENVQHATLEVTRLYRKYKDKYENTNISELNKKERAEYAYFQEIKEAYEERLAESEEQRSIFMQYLFIMRITSQIVEEALDGVELTPENVQSFETDNDTVLEAIRFMQMAWENEWTEDYFAKGYEQYNNLIEYGLNPDFDSRPIVGDDPTDPKEQYYGNNNVEGPDAEHGTHVAGIIGAERGNGLGMNGIAPNVKIMAIRAVPDGDERDKDVANAIRYAVDNGAQIVNMSFGKSYSPNKKVVDKAIKYARRKGVLLIHAAGNDNENIDIEENFPTRSLKGSHSKKWANNWIEVGASSWGRDDSFVAAFSNYGNQYVDIFAPGKDIYSTVPDEKFEKNDGTSMAAPVVSGIAATLLSYYPDLKYKELRQIILDSAVRYTDREVNKPGSGEMVPFGNLSSTGGIANLYEAVKLAEELSN